MGKHLGINLQLFAMKYDTSAIKGDKRLKIDMANDIALLTPSAAPFLALTKRISKEKANSYRYEWLERELEARLDKAAGSVTNVATTVPVENGSYFRIGMVVKVPKTEEVLMVTGVAGNNLTVTRSYGETAAAAISTGDELLIIGNANEEGAKAPDDAGGNPTSEYNFTQIFRTPFSVTNTANAVQVYGSGKLLTQEQKEKGVLHRIDMERAFLFGERTEDNSGSSPKRTTRGLLKFITENVLDVSADGILTEDMFNNHLEGVFAYGSQKKTLLASPRLISVISSWGREKLQTVSEASAKYGIHVVRYISPHGELNIVKEPLFNGPYAGHGVILDMGDIKYKPLRDTKLKTNIQDNDADGRRDEYLTEAGLKLILPKHHGMIVGATKSK